MDWNGHRSRLLALLVLSPWLLLSAGSAAHAQQHDWGMPPENDYVIPAGETAMHTGWQRFYSPQEYTDLAGCNGELVFVAGKNGLDAVELYSGELRWNHGGDLSFSHDILFYGSDFLIASISGYPTALDLRYGHQIWRADWHSVLGYCSAGLWFTDRAERNENGDWIASRVGIADPATGEMLRGFETGPIDSFSHEILLDRTAPFRSGSQSVLAIQQGTEIHAYSPEGLQWTVPLRDDLAYAQMCSVPQGLLVCEYREYRHLMKLAAMETDTEDSRLQEALGWTSDGSSATADYLLRLLDPQDGAELWSSMVSSEEFGPHYGDVLQAGDQRSVLALETWIELADGGSTTAELGKVIDNDTGKLLGEVGTDTSFARTSWQPARREWPLPAERDLEMSCSYPPLERDATITLPGGIDPFSGVWLDHMFTVLSMVHEEGADNSGYEVLYGLQLDDDCNWLPGEPRRFGFPLRDDSVARRFLESPDPLADNGLMRDMVQSGKTSFMLAAEQFAQLNRSQHDALLELALYLEQHDGRGSSLSSPLRELLDSAYGSRCIVHRNASPELVPMLIDWYKRPDTGFYHDRLAGLLAACGGSVAGDFLDGLYEISLEQEYAPAAAPYAVPRDHRDPPEMTVSAAVQLDDGDRVIACVAGWLAGRDIVLMVDRAGDGTYDVCLPTGLADVHARWFFPGGVEGEAEMNRRISLELDNGLKGRLRIGHHELAEEAPMSLDGNTAEPSGVSFVVSELDMAELLLDSDGDGLTDITERFSFTDPHQADSDADGIDDGHDRFPNADMSACTALERGIARAMQFQFLRDYGSEIRNRSTAGQRPRGPLSLSYLALEGVAAVPRAPDARNHYVMLTTAEQLEQYRSLLAGYNSFSVLHVSVEEIAADGKRLGGDFMFSQTGSDIPFDGQYIIHLDYSGAGDEILLVELEGEYYPVAIVGGWIS